MVAGRELESARELSNLSNSGRSSSAFSMTYLFLEGNSASDESSHTLFSPICVNLKEALAMSSDSSEDESQLEWLGNTNW